jgi:hypothetical protein
LEIFIADSAEYSRSSGVALTAAAAITHFCALKGFGSPCKLPRIGKMLGGIWLTHGKAFKPKEPFTPAPIVTFMNLARKGTLREWRAALPLALCFQQLLRGAECFDLNGSNVFLETSRLLHTTDGNFYRVTVETSKNHPEGFNFSIRIDADRPNCVGVFMSEFISIKGIRLGDPTLFFACKLAQISGSFKASSSDRMADSTMRSACMLLITAAGLDPRLYATHSSKRGGTLEALRQGLTDAQIQELGPWSSDSMVSRYVRGSEEVRDGPGRGSQDLEH